MDASYGEVASLFCHKVVLLYWKSCMKPILGSTALARRYLWWLKMDAKIEAVVKTCITCQELRPSPPVAPAHPWQWPSQPRSRSHLDFVGPHIGHMFLVIVDRCSKWLDARVMSSIALFKTIEIL